MRRIAATYILTPDQNLKKDSVLICENDGTVIEIIENREKKEWPGVEYYSGIIVPGFVNVHCHLELSNLKGNLEERKGIGEFIGEINRLRYQETEDLEMAMHIADRKMWAAGIAAVGDITNSIHTIDVKLKSKIFFHTFVESFGFHPARAEKSFNYARFVHDEFSENGLSASIVPHSAYSVSEPLLRKIGENANTENSIISIHNQESLAEAQFFMDGTGPIANHLQHNLNIDISHWIPTGKSPISTILRFLPRSNPLILVHNTFTKKADLEELAGMRSTENTFIALCPNSNLYIENQLPPVDLFRSEKTAICLGTDSLASNYKLSILSEMITLQQNFPELKLEELFKWSGLNGAKALGIEKSFGSFSKGKKPGVNLITAIDFKNLKLSENSKVKRLI